MDLFEHRAQNHKEGHPLASKLRPEELADVLGQEHLTGEGKFISEALKRDRFPSLIFFGPPGTGKTTLSLLIAKKTKSRVFKLSAVSVGSKELREAIREAKELRYQYGRPSILLLDEIHRLNKAQQDILLPHVEDGLLTIIGATTENPSFEVNRALLSRLHVLRLKSISPDQMRDTFKRVFQLAEYEAFAAQISDALLLRIAKHADGDLRKGLTILEGVLESSKGIDIDGPLEEERVEELLSQSLAYSKSGDEKYHLISAFIKSMRDGDEKAAPYWAMRMVEAGEDPRYLFRRMMVFASEDIGIADTHALPTVAAAFQSYELTGLPEGAYPLVHAAVYLAKAPKSRYIAEMLSASRKAATSLGSLPVPRHLRNHNTRISKMSKALIEEAETETSDCLPPEAKVFFPL